MNVNGTHNHGPLAGLGAGAAAVLFAFGVLALAWHRVAGQVSAAIAVLAYAVIAAVAFISGAGAFYAFLWVRHRARHPELLSGRRAPPPVMPVVPPAIEAAPRAAIGPPRVYLTDDQFAMLRQQVTVPQLSRDDHGQGTR